MANERAENLVNMLDAYVSDGGYHLNVNVFNRDTLLDLSLIHISEPTRPY